MRQVFLNLMQNANKFTYEGSITVSIDYDPINLYIIGEVCDTGLGISEEDQ